ncbi:MAG: PIG-L deacetylase family protein [Candidatus Woesearchaeota archaeon]
MPKERVMVVCAHPDDEVFGMGGTIAKYVQEGKEVTVLRFSFGEKSHQWLKESVTKKIRSMESDRVQEFLGFKSVISLGLEEGTFSEQKQQIADKLVTYIKALKPHVIFTHNIMDPHTDHNAVGIIVMEAVEKIRFKGEMYMFDVWNVLNFRRIDHPKLYVDITATFSKKVGALKLFKSQWTSMISLLWSVYFRAILHGLALNVRFAERFYRIK